MGRLEFIAHAYAEQQAAGFSVFLITAKEGILHV